MSDSIYAPHNHAKLQAARAAEAATATATASAPASPTPEAVPAPQQTNEDGLQRPHPHLTRPLLYISGVDATMTDKELAGLVFDQVLPVRLRIDRTVAEGQTASGTIEFQTLDKAEKAYATVRPPIQLRIQQDSSSKEPTASAKPRLVKQLPPGTDDASLFDLFRPFGPLRRAQCLLTNPAGIHTGFKGRALLEFYSEDDAQRAESEMHCRELGGKSISVVVDTNTRKVSASAAEFRPSAAPFVPASSGGMSPSAPLFAPSAPGSRSVSAGSSASIYATSSSPAQKGARGQLQYSSQASTFVDPCNLFIKNLDADIESKDLYDTFKAFGHIVSARVMRDNDGKSREFGFVSFKVAEDATQALHAMDNAKLGSKKITVRLHEPKTMRQEKLAARFNAANAESTDAGSAGSSVDGRHAETSRKTDKRQSRSYFKAGVPADANGLADEEQLRSLSSVVRNELLSGEFTRRVQQVPSIDEAHVDGVVSALLKLKLGDAVEALNNPISLIQRVNDAREQLAQSPAPASMQAPSMLGAQNPAMLGVQAQSSVSSTSSNGEGGASSKERERLLKAVRSVAEADAPVEDITDMLASLPKKDRALALFNPEFLKQKVDEAKDILDITDDSGEDLSPPPAGNGSSAVAAPAVLKDASNGQDSTSATAQTHTLSSLAALPAVEIVRLANSPSSAGLPLAKPDAETVAATDAFIDSLQGKAAHDQKQKLGDQLFKKVRSFGVKGAPKLTIHLLDSEELRALAHLMNSYEDVLREKVQQKVAAGLNK
ncbi:related to polyadenylate-binding protein 3 [Sporisorium reilianum f. sp. reilianum]|uniref:Related to polyadenylate-binding protein 3 n=1 Tax=Sporisorium reilianum f. sp. reilianum TaxID=72559 RepID=A0A2N8UFL7_9BASI|nr:related to polyadenylate-binding protein 3 [Sporisorium reilianum f. sp. reilianum]